MVENSRIYYFLWTIKLGKLEVVYGIV